MTRASTLPAILVLLALLAAAPGSGPGGRCGHLAVEA